MNSIKREVAVAFSLRAQPIWFRIVKWTAFIGITLLLRKTPYLWWWIGGVLLLGLGGHFFYRRMTHGWTRAWGGWKDLESGRK